MGGGCPLAAPSAGNLLRACAPANSRQSPGPRAPGSSNLDTKARGPLHVYGPLCAGAGPLFADDRPASRQARAPVPSTPSSPAPRSPGLPRSAGREPLRAQHFREPRGNAGSRPAFHATTATTRGHSAGPASGSNPRSSTSHRPPPGDGCGSSDVPAQLCGQVRDQAAVGIHTFLDVGQVPAVDDAVQPLRAADEDTGLGARQ